MTAPGFGEVTTPSVGGGEGVAGSGSTGRLAARGAVWGLLNVVGIHVLFLLATLALVRLLSPRDFGLIDMVAVLVEMVLIAFHWGPSTLTLQKPDLSEDENHGLFWINVALGLVVFLVFLLVRGSMVRFFGQPELEVIVVFLGMGIFIRSFGVQPGALLARRFDTKSLCVVALCSEAVASVVALVMASRGWGWKSLVVRRLLQSSLQSAGHIWASGYRPAFPRARPDWLRFLRFGGAVAAAALLGTFCLSVGKAMVGRTLGPEALGFFARSFFLVTLPFVVVRGAFGRVATPALARSFGRRDDLARIYGVLVEMMAVLAFPVAAGLVAIAPVTVSVLYGRAWLPVVPLVHAMAGFLFVAGFSELAAWAFTARHRLRLQLALQLAFTAGHSLVVVLVSSEGAAAVALVYSVSYLLYVLVAQYVFHRVEGIEAGENLGRILRPLCAAIGMGGLVYASSLFLERVVPGLVLRFLLLVAEGVVAYLVLLRLLLRERIAVYRDLWEGKEGSVLEGIPEAEHVRRSGA